MSYPLRELVPGLIWVKEHPVRLGGGRLLTRMTVIRLRDGLCLHSPVEIDAATHAALDALGQVVAIVAPSNCHHLFVGSAQSAFPEARTYAVRGLETKRKDLRFDELVDGEAPSLWRDQMDQVVLGNRVMHEIVLLHRASRTLVGVDFVENFRDETPGVDAVVRTYLRLLRMWGRPRPAPELRLFTRDRAGARAAVETILSWDFDRAVIAHGELLTQAPHEAIREAWRWVLTRPAA